MIRALRLTWLLIFAAFIAVPCRAWEFPAWAKSLPPVPDAKLLGAANSVVLLDDTTIYYSADGYATMERRYVVKILRNEGRDDASAGVYYNSKSGKVLGAKAWLIRAGEVVESKSKGDWVDMAEKAEAALVDDSRSLKNSLEDKAVAGDLYAAETSMRGKVLLASESFVSLARHSPEALDSLTIVVPQGWSVKPKFVGIPPAETTEPAPRTYRWVWKNLPYRPSEGYTGDEPIGVVFTLSGPGMPLLAFSSWNDVGSYTNSLAATQCDSDPAMAQKVREVTAGETTPLGKIRKLAGLAQRTRYISINRDLHLGRGFQPRKASEVFKTGYGDCKDKANFLRAMLREVGVTSYPVHVYVADGAQIDPEIPSPGAFNHAMLAIEVGEDVTLNAVQTLENGKRVLFFDPTNPNTLLGDIPDYEQGTLVCVSTDSGAMLHRLVEIAPEVGFKSVRKLKLKFGVGGSLTASGSVDFHGQRAAWAREQVEKEGLDAQMEKYVKRQLNDNFKGAKVTGKSFSNDENANVASLKFDLEQQQFLQVLPGSRAIAKFDLLNKATVPVFTEKIRETVIRLDPSFTDDFISVELPDGLDVEELPKSSHLESPYGAFTLEVKRQGNLLELHRTVLVNRVQAPAADYAKIKTFFTGVARADRAAAILKAVPLKTP